MLRTAIYWAVGSFIALLAAFLYFGKSLMSDMTLVIWLLAGVIIVYLAKREKDGKKAQALSENSRRILAATGILVAAFSFADQILPVLGIDYVFWNPPYSIGEFAVLLSGLTITFFSLKGYRKLILPAAVPAVIFTVYQIFDLLGKGMETASSPLEVIAAPLLEPTTILSITALKLLGIGAYLTPVDPAHPQYIIEFLSRAGQMMRIEIVTDCTGIWSLGAFTASLLLVSIGFPKVFSRASAPYIVIGYAGTYVANITRVVAICVSAYLYGYSGSTAAVHMHAGWIAFSGWMLIFWYLFFSKRLLKDAAKAGGLNGKGRPAGK